MFPPKCAECKAGHVVRPSFAHVRRDYDFFSPIPLFIKENPFSHPFC